MTVGSYQTSTKTLWFFVIDLPVGDDGKRRQHKRRGFPSKTAAEKAETEARKAYGEAAIGADGSVAAELSGWLSERELDIEETTLDYRNLFRMYVIPHIGGRQLYSLDKRVVQDMYKTLVKEGGSGKKPLSETTVRTVHRVLMKAFKDLGSTWGRCVSRGRLNVRTKDAKGCGRPRSRSSSSGSIVILACMRRGRSRWSLGPGAVRSPV
jgi:hypothetical protein